MGFMSAIRERLLECFVIVFPGKVAAEFPNANIDNLPTWDSSNHILLMQVIEEQFGFPVDEDRMDDLVSFSALEAYLNSEGHPH